MTVDVQVVYDRVSIFVRHGNHGFSTLLWQDRDYYNRLVKATLTRSIT